MDHEFTLKNKQKQCLRYKLTMRPLFLKGAHLLLGGHLNRKQFLQKCEFIIQVLYSFLASRFCCSIPSDLQLIFYIFILPTSELRGAAILL